jgi:hypothetical protein
MVRTIKITAILVDKDNTICLTIDVPSQRFLRLYVIVLMFFQGSPIYGPELASLLEILVEAANEGSLAQVNATKCLACAEKYHLFF